MAASDKNKPKKKNVNGKEKTNEINADKNDRIFVYTVGWNRTGICTVREAWAQSLYNGDKEPLCFAVLIIHRSMIDVTTDASLFDIGYNTSGTKLIKIFNG